MDNKISFIISAASFTVATVLSYKVAKKNTEIRSLIDDNMILLDLIQEKNRKYKRAIKKLSFEDKMELAAKELEDVVFNDIVKNA